MSAVIHHNPACGTPRHVLAILRAPGAEPTVMDHQSEGWTRPQLLGLFAAAGLTPRDALRLCGTPAEAMGLTAPDGTDAALVAARVAHPVLVNRPIVGTPKRVRLCRPSEVVPDLLDRLPPGPLPREDGTFLIDAGGKRV